MLVEKLLEEGDSLDLRYLAAEIGEAELAEWFRVKGGRRLAARSRIFWSLLFDCPVPAPNPLADQIWPL